MIRLALRIMILLLAIAIVAGLVFLIAQAVPGLAAAGRQRGFDGIRLHRRLKPQPGAVIEYFGKFVLVGAIAFVGRRFFKLHL